MATSSGNKALQVIHYITPLAVVVSFLVTKVVATCLLYQPSRRAGVPLRRYTTIAIQLLVIGTLIAQGIWYLVQSTSGQTYATQDELVYILASCVAYTSLTLGLLENKKPLWNPYLAAWLMGLALEVPCAALQATSFTTIDALPFNLVQNFVEPGRSTAHTWLQVVRCLGLLVLVVFGCFHGLADRRNNTKHDSESEALLSNGINGQATTPSPRLDYGGTEADSTPPSTTKDDDEDDDDADFDSDSEEPERDKELKALQRKRLEQSGNWFNYMQEFKIFIPMLWPSGKPLVQACLGVVGAVIVAERFLNVLVPRQLGIITDQLAANHGTGVIPWSSVMMWMIYAWLNSQAGLDLAKSLAELPIQQFAYKSIGSAAFGHIMGLSMNFHNEKNSGELIRAIEQGQNLQGLLEFAFFEVAPMFIDLFVAFGFVYSLFDVYMALILLVVGLMYVWIGAKTTSWSIKRRRRFNTAWRNESKVQNEAINNWQTVSHFNRGAYECERYGKTIDNFNAAEWQYYLSYYIGGGAQSFVMLLGRLAATTLAVYRVVQGRAPVGHFVTLAMYWRSIESPLMQVSWSIRRVSQMLTDSERLLQLMQTKATVSDVPDAPDIDIKAGEVVFENVRFAYDPRRTTLKNVSFVAKPGQTVALVGETGGGKSTILKLLYRYYDVEGGSIRIDGQDLRSVKLDSLRDAFGMVPQDPSLFNVSLIENIKYARLDATDAEVEKACKAAAIHDKIESFPDKYQSTVGERGVKLSGGELQRVSIARAILKQPKIVLLDEATSMIDAETESLIQKALKRLTAGRTTFVIAHRLSTIQHADLILVINDGHIVERGTHDELFHQNGKYVALWSKQVSKEVQDIGKALDGKKESETVVDVSEDQTTGDGAEGAW